MYNKYIVLNETERNDFLSIISHFKGDHETSGGRPMGPVASPGSPSGYVPVITEQQITQVTGQRLTQVIFGLVA